MQIKSNGLLIHLQDNYRNLKLIFSWMTPTFQLHLKHCLIKISSATIEDAVKNLEKADTIHAKISLTFQNSKPPKNNLSKNERKCLKPLQSDTSIVILPTEKRRPTVILTCEKYLDHINNSPYQLLKRDPSCFQDHS